MLSRFLCYHSSGSPASFREMFSDPSGSGVIFGDNGAFRILVQEQFRRISSGI